MSRIATTIALGFVLGVVGLFIGGALSWGYYSSGVSRVVAIAFNWPYFVAHAVLPDSSGDTAWQVIVLIIHFTWYIGMVWLIRAALARFSRAAA